MDEQNKKLLEKLAKRYFAREILLLCTIPGIQKYSVMSILSEIDNDMSDFGKAFHLIGWAGLHPRNDESAGKIQSRKILHGNKYLRQMLIEVFWSAARSNKTFLGKKYYYLSKWMKIAKGITDYNPQNTRHYFQRIANRKAF